MSKVILLIEDDPNDQALTLRAFKKNNIPSEIVVMDDGAKAIEYLFDEKAFDDPENYLPSLILLDLNLPKVNGREVLRRIHESKHLKNIPVVILTASKEESDLVTCYSLGANSYIRKPVNFNQFVDTVQQLGLYWLELNEVPPTIGRNHYD